MLVRAGDGEWQQLRPVGDVPEGGFRSLCGLDAANLLELDDPMPVVLFGTSGDTSMVDAICLTHDGGIALLAATFGEDPSATLWRLMNVAGQLRGMTLDVFAANCSEVDLGTPAQWLAHRAGGDARELEARMASVLESGAFDLVLVTSNGPGDLATPMRFLQTGPALVRVYEVEVLRAGDVQAIEGIEVTLDGERAEGAPVRRLEIVADPAPAHEPVIEPEWQSQPEEQPVPTSQEAEWEAFHAEDPAPEVEAATEPAAEEAVAEAPVVEEPAAETAAEADPAPEPELGEPSDETSFVAAIDRLDHRSSALMRFLHERLLTFVGHREYTRDQRMEYFVGWTHGTDPRPLVGLDSAGSFTVVLSSLPGEEQAEYAAELAGLLPEGDAAKLLEGGVAELSVMEHLNDETLLEYVIDNLAEALPGGREAFEAAAAAAPAAAEGRDEPPASDVGDDFFAGVSADHDPAEIAESVGTPASEPIAEDAPPAHVPAPSAAPVAPTPPRGGFARRLRRRDAA